MDRTFKPNWLLAACLSISLVVLRCHAQDAQNFPNFQYGSDPQNIIDVYMPAGRNLSSKIILLIHGGGWSGGSKEDMNGSVAWFQWLFPQHVIVNMNYRLGTVESPGLVKQLSDIAAVIDLMKKVSPNFNITPEFALYGVSAGGHLAMLHSYGFDFDRDVKVVVNGFGPSSFEDPAYRVNPYFGDIVKALVGNTTYEQNPYIYQVSSPINYVTSDSPKTIGFYGDVDPLIPNSQGALLEDKLDSVGVYNKYYLYKGVGHGNFDATSAQHVQVKLYYFLKNYF